MNREELVELVSTAWRFGLTSRSADDLVDKLWPVLAQVWEEGRNDCLNKGLWQPNPYCEVPA